MTTITLRNFAPEHYPMGLAAIAEFRRDHPDQPAGLAGAVDYQGDDLRIRVYRTRAGAIVANCEQRDGEDRRIAAVQGALHQKSADTWAAIRATMTRPSTIADIMHRLPSVKHRTSIGHHLRKALARGEVSLETVEGVNIWDIAK